MLQKSDPLLIVRSVFRVRLFPVSVDDVHIDARHFQA
jgi:hypothetical protein